MRTTVSTAVILLLGFVAALAAKADSASAGGTLTLDQALALDVARRHLLAQAEKVTSAELSDYNIVPLDPNTWGKYCWAFQFPKHGNSQFHVSKESGFVLEMHVLSDDPTQTGGGYMSSSGNLSPGISRRVPLPTLRKRERWSDYLITVTIPPTLALEREEVGFGCQLWEASGSVRPYHHQEFKEMLLLKSVNHVRTLTLTIAKSDAEHFPIIDIYFLTTNSGTHISPRITDIPNE